MVKAHPVQGRGGGLLPVGAEGVHPRVVALPRWPGKHSAVPEHPSSAPSRCEARPWGFRSRPCAGTQALRSQPVRAWWPATALLPPLMPWGCSGSTGPGRTLESSWGYAVTAPRGEGRQRGEVLGQEGIREKVLPPECRRQQSRSATGPLTSSWDPQRTLGRDPYLKAVVSHPRKAGPMLLSFRRRLSCRGERFQS